MCRQLVLKAAATLAAKRFGVDASEVFGPTRGLRSTVAARHWAYLQLNQGLVPGQGAPWSGSEIGHALGRDVSTVTTVLKKARRNGL